MFVCASLCVCLCVCVHALVSFVAVTVFLMVGGREVANDVADVAVPRQVG